MSAKRASRNRRVSVSIGTVPTHPINEVDAEGACDRVCDGSWLGLAARFSGNTSNLNDVLADDLQFDIQRGDYVKTLDKNQLIDYLKNNTTSDPSVKITTTVMREDDNSSVIKVEFKYDGYSRTDEVTLNKTFGWVITTVACTFM